MKGSHRCEGCYDAGLEYWRGTKVVWTWGACREDLAHRQGTTQGVPTAWAEAKTGTTGLMWMLLLAARLLLAMTTGTATTVAVVVTTTVAATAARLWRWSEGAGVGGAAVGR